MITEGFSTNGQENHAHPARQRLIDIHLDVISAVLDRNKGATVHIRGLGGDTIVTSAKESVDEVGRRIDEARRSG